LREAQSSRDKTKKEFIMADDKESLTLTELEANPGETLKDAQPITANDLDAVYGIPVEVAAVLGKAEMQVSHLLKLGRGAVIELDRKVGEAIDIYVNNRLVARGEVVVVEDRLGITMTEIIKSDRNN
jgi:flagellar motor switch protein FliN/FliY